MNDRLLVFLVLIQLVTCQRRWVHLETPETCDTPHNTPGTCTPLRKCQPIMELIKDGPTREEISYIRRSICKFEGGMPDVCCPAGSVSMTWSGWSAWSQCSAKCGAGVQFRYLVNVKLKHITQIQLISHH